MVAKWTIAMDLIEDVRGSIAMYMFIIEESIQAVGMACYLNYRAGKKDKAKEIAKWCLDELVTPAIDFARTWGYPAYPLNISYEMFYLAAEKTMRSYLEL